MISHILMGTSLVLVWSDCFPSEGDIGMKNCGWSDITTIEHKKVRFVCIFRGMNCIFKHQSSVVLALSERNPTIQWPVDSLYKLPVMRKQFPYLDANIVMLDVIPLWMCSPYRMLFCWASFFYYKVLYFIPFFYYPQTVSVIMNPIFQPSLIFAWCHRMLHKTPWATHSTSQEIWTCVVFCCVLLWFDKSPFALYPSVLHPWHWYNIDELV